MFIKLIVKILLGNKSNLVKAVKLKGKNYLITIEEYKPISQIIKDWQRKVL